MLYHREGPSGWARQPQHNIRATTRGCSSKQGELRLGSRRPGLEGAGLVQMQLKSTSATAWTHSMNGRVQNLLLWYRGACAH